MLFAHFPCDHQASIRTEKQKEMPAVPQLVTTQKVKWVDLPEPGQHQVAELPDQSSSLPAFSTIRGDSWDDPRDHPKHSAGHSRVCATTRIEPIPLTTAIKLFGRKCHCAQKET